MVTVTWDELDEYLRAAIVTGKRLEDIPPVIRTAHVWKTLIEHGLSDAELLAGLATLPPDRASEIAAQSRSSGERNDGSFIVQRCADALLNMDQDECKRRLARLPAALADAVLAWGKESFAMRLGYNLEVIPPAARGPSVCAAFLRDLRGEALVQGMHHVPQNLREEVFRLLLFVGDMWGRCMPAQEALDAFQGDANLSCLEAAMSAEAVRRKTAEEASSSEEASSDEEDEESEAWPQWANGAIREWVAFHESHGWTREWLIEFLDRHGQEIPVSRDDWPRARR
jgi:hypothetical protein